VTATVKRLLCLLDRRAGTRCLYPCLGGHGFKSGQGVTLLLVRHDEDLDESVASRPEERNLQPAGWSGSVELGPNSVLHSRHVPLKSISGDLCGSESPFSPIGNLLLGR
jgi:hypothetical protein